MSALDGLDVITGAVRLRDLGYAACSDAKADADTPAHSFPIAWDSGTWRHADAYAELEWIICGVCISSRDIEQAVFVGTQGDVLCLGSGDTHIERIGGPNERGRSVPPLRGVVSVMGDAYAFGTGRQVYRRTGHLQWIELSHSIRPRKEDESLVSIEALGGFGESELYAAGLDGELFRFDGQAWFEIPTDTNMILSALCCADDGCVYIGGQRGVLLKGRGDAWAQVSSTEMNDEIWGLAWFLGHLYVATLEGLYTLNGDGSLVRVAFGKLRPKSFMHLSARDGVLWSIGNREILSFDGTAWSRVL